MPKKDQEITITEIAEFEPSRVDGVGKGANGFPILMLKAVDGESDDRKDCDTCEGSGKIMQGNRKCPDCFGSGKSPKVGETAKQFLEFVGKEAGVAPSGANDPYPTGDCPTCNGSGTIADGSADGKQCVDCGGTGKDQNMTNPIELNAVPGDAGRISVGDPEGREMMDKADGGMTCDCGANCPADAKYCPGCGAKITAAKGNDADGFRPAPYKPDPDETVQCPKCEKMNDTDAAYCDQCGHELMGDDKVMVDGEPLVADDDDDAMKAEMSTADINDLPDSAFAHIESGGTKDDEGKTTPRSLRHFPIHDAAHVRNALARVSQSPHGDNAMPKIKAAAKKFGIEVSDDAQKADGSFTQDGATFSGMNPAMSPAADASDDDTTPQPGSPDWEAVDAATATQAAQALMQAAELIRQFAQRESMEVAAGEGNDIFDAGAAEGALMGVSQALGIMAQLAFHENLEAQKSVEGEVQKAGKRLSGKSVAALAAARDHLNNVLGDDDPAKKNQDDDDDADDAKSAVKNYMANANKALLSKEIEDMSTDELEKVLDARDERLVEMLAGVLKGKALDDQTDSVDNAKDANNKSKKKSPKDEMTDLEDEAMQGDNESASGTNQATGAAKSEGEEGEEEAVKAELTPEEIEAKRARKEAKKALKAARAAEKEAAENAAVQKAIAEGVAEATAAVVALQERLATVEKMAAPSTLVRTRPQDALTKSAERDELEMRLAQLERIARETPDNDIRKASREEAKEVRDRIAGLSA